MTATDAAPLLSRVSTRVSHNEAVVAAVAVGQTLGLGALLITWVAVAFRPVMRPLLRRRTAAGQAASAVSIPGHHARA